MRIGILQPSYLPWLGFFEQMYKSDIFVIYDDVQYDKHGWRNRNRIKSANGVQWITVPVLTKNKNKPLVKDVILDNRENWRRKHLNSLKLNYGKAAYFEEYIGIFEECYSREWELLLDLNIELISKICSVLGIKREIKLSSDLGISGDRIERLVKICKHFGADEFYEGKAGENYLDENVFLEQGITLKYQDYKHPEYRQLYGEFVPYMSVVDLIFNEGERSLKILTENTEN